MSLSYAQYAKLLKLVMGEELERVEDFIGAVQSGEARGGNEYLEQMEVLPSKEAVERAFEGVGDSVDAIIARLEAKDEKTYLRVRDLMLDA